MIGSNDTFIGLAEDIEAEIGSYPVTSTPALLRITSLFVSFFATKPFSNLRLTCCEFARSYLAGLDSLSSTDLALLPKEWSEAATAFIDSLLVVPETAASSSKASALFNGANRTIADDWAECKNSSPQDDNQSPSPALDKLMSMTGLETVKRSMLTEFHRIQIAKEQGVVAGSDGNYNTRFDGNPGTGKTTVARLYGKFLVDLKVLPDSSMFKETTGSSLISAGVNGLKKMLDEIKGAVGGVVFVDEAYQ